MISKMCTFSCRLPMARSRIPAPRSPGNATRRNGASATSFHSASPSSPLLSSPRCSSASRCAGSHFFLRFEQSAQLDRCGFDIWLKAMRLFMIGVGQGHGAGRGAPKRPRACRSAGPLAAADPRRPSRPARPCPGGAPIEKMAGFAGLWRASGASRRGMGSENAPRSNARLIKGGRPR